MGSRGRAHELARRLRLRRHRAWVRRMRMVWLNRHFKRVYGRLEHAIPRLPAFPLLVAPDGRASPC